MHLQLHTDAVKRYTVMLVTLYCLIIPSRRIARAQTRIDYLSADLLPAIANPSAAIFVGRVRQVRPTQSLSQGGFTYNLGTLTLDVQESLSAQSPRTGAVIEVPFHQIADTMIRLKNGRDQWNLLPLVQGTLILFAAPPANGSALHPTAAAFFNSPDDPKLKAIRLACSIQRAPAQQKPRLLAQALQSSDITLVSYALDALGERSALGPQQGLRLIAEALTNPTTPAGNRKELAYTLTNRFDAIQDTQAQATAVAALAYAMVHTTDKESQATYASYLRACILGDLNDNSTHRDTLLRTIQNPPPVQVVRSLTTLAHDPHAEPDPQERSSLAKLAHIWQHASELKP